MCLFPLLSACAIHEAPPPPPLAESPNFANGLLPLSAPPPPLDPTPPDARAFARFQSATDDLGDPALAQELAELFVGTSQTFQAAIAPPLFQAGVVHGNPALLELACTTEARVSYAAFRRARDLDELRGSCRLLHEDGGAADGVCGAALRELRSGYALLVRGEESAARTAIAHAVRVRVTCPGTEPPPQVPVALDGRGFLLLSVLHGLDAPPATWLAGQARAPSFPQVVNDGFVDNQKLLE